jgi:hypothetical protein
MVMLSRSNLMLSRVPLAVKKTLHSHGGSFIRSISSLSVGSSLPERASVNVFETYPRIAACNDHRLFSSRADIVQQSPGTVTKTLRVLDMSTVKTILEELRSVDVNADGR